MSDDFQPSSRPLSDRDDALTIVKRLRGAGHVAYFAGGCVRDLLLGMEPKDYDVATDAPPQRVRKLFRNTQAVGAAFGVILVRLGQRQIEVATFRADGDYEDGRHPVGVRFTSAEEDAKRRDFTINGLFLDPIDDRVIDHVGGQEDLKAKVLRAIGDPNHRFEEDHLRLLRAVRFASRFGLTIDPATASAISMHGKHLTRISPERIAEELRLMLTSTTRTRAWELLSAYSLDDVVFRFLQLPWKDPHPEILTNRKPVLFHRVLADDAIPFSLALAAASLEYAANSLPHLAEWPRLLKEVTIRSMVHALRQSLRLSNDETDGMEGTLYGLEILLKQESHSVATLKRFLGRPTADLSRAIYRALPEDSIDARDRQAIEQRLLDLGQTDFAPPPFITGDDLTAAGLRPGKLFKRILDDVYDAQLEDRITSKADAMSLALEIAKSSA